MPGAWTSPRTWVNGETETDVIFNAQIRDNMLWLGGTTGIITQTAANGYLGAISTTSASMVSTGDSATLTTQASGVVLAFYSGTFSATTSGQIATFGIGLDGSVPTINGASPSPTASGVQFHVSFSLLFTGLSAAVHTFTGFWAISGGITLSQGNAGRQITLLEVRR